MKLIKLSLLPLLILTAQAFGATEDNVIFTKKVSYKFRTDSKKLTCSSKLTRGWGYGCNSYVQVGNCPQRLVTTASFQRRSLANDLLPHPPKVTISNMFGNFNLNCDAVNQLISDNEILDVVEKIVASTRVTRYSNGKCYASLSEKIDVMIGPELIFQSVKSKSLTNSSLCD